MRCAAAPEAAFTFILVCASCEICGVASNSYLQHLPLCARRHPLSLHNRPINNNKKNDISYLQGNETALIDIIIKRDVIHLRLNSL